MIIFCRGKQEDTDHGEKRRIPGRSNAGKYGKFNETGAENAASDGRAGTDLIVAAINEALDKADEESASAMSRFTGGMGGAMPGLF